MTYRHSLCLRPKTAAPRPYRVPLAMAIASSSVSYLRTVMSGAKTSCCAMAIEGVLRRERRERRSAPQAPRLESSLGKEKVQK